MVPSSSHYDPSEPDYEERRASHDLLLDDEEDVPSKSAVEENVVVEEETPIEWHPALVMLANGLKTIFSPIFRIVFAPQSQRAMIKSLVIVILVAWILMTSFTAYLTFYQRYIPKTAHIEPIYFQYSNTDLPKGQVQFTGPNPIMVREYD